MILLTRAIFLRHGQSEYTEKFPDLTAEGEQIIRKSAEEIKAKWLQWGSPYVCLLTSPKMRALGSTALIKESLGYCDEIKICPAISAVELRNVAKALEIFREYKKTGVESALEINYPFDPRFEDEKIFEPRSEIKRRFFTYLKSFIRQAKELDSPRLFIHITHYEVLYPLIESIFGDCSNEGGVLSYGELLVVSLYDDCLEIRFRGKRKKVGLDGLKWLSL